MKLTNKNNYPDAVVKAVQDSLHRPEEGIYGVTSLVDAPLVRHLRLTRWDDLETDVDDYLVALFGTAWHAFMEKHETSQTEVGWVYNTHGVIVRGKADVYHDNNGRGSIDDHKVVSAWSFVFGTKEWERQLNIYALLAQKNGYPVDGLFINAFIKDWSKWDAMKSREYPSKRFFRIGVPLWTLAQQEEYLDSRLQLHLAEPTECTPAEKWQTPDTYAVMKPHRKTAMRVLPTESAAYEWIAAHSNFYRSCSAKQNNGLTVVKRAGECKRCESFCSVRSVCPYMKGR